MDWHFLAHSSVILLLYSLSISEFTLSSNCQFIAHINSKGLKGNLTFDLIKDGETHLVIESFIETDDCRRTILNNKENSTIEDPIQFDWTFHTNTIEGSALNSCSEDDLGPKERLINTIAENRSIVLNRLNSWTLNLEDFPFLNSTQKLSSLIWGKSIRLKLSSSYASKQQVAQPSKEISKETSKEVLPTSAIGRPQLKQLPPSSTQAPSKPTFAPRPKPNISNRVKSVSIAPPVLPKAESLVLELDPISNNGTENTAPKNASTEELEARKQQVFKTFGRRIVCANIIDSRAIKTAEANFESQIAGKVDFRGNEDDVTLITLNLYYIKAKVSKRHEWRLLASDILDTGRHEDECKYLQVLFDPNNVNDTDCRKDAMANCRMGDLTRKHGQVSVAGQGKSSRITLVDLNLPMSALESSRSLFLAIYETTASSSGSGGKILSCAKIKPTVTRKVETIFSMDGVRGSIRMSQRHKTEPTTVTYDLFGLEGNVKHLTLRELPLVTRSSSDNNKICHQLGDIYNPYKVQDTIIAGDFTTIDRIKVGNLSAKMGQLSVIDSEYEDHYMGEYIDLSIQLYGIHTVVGRSIVIHKNNGDLWACASIDYVDELVSLAVATFYYPVVGQIIFQQLTNNPSAETGVLIDIYNPNSEKNSIGHNWMIHTQPAMADFYNWSQRCESSGDVYDPFESALNLSNELYQRQCSAGIISSESLRCKTGDTGLKSGIKLSLPVSHKDKSRFYYTDPYLPLSKSSSIIGRSVVIYDEQAPTQRGNRLACSTIKSIHPLRAAIRSWDSGPSIPSNVRGSVVFEQESQLRPTKIKLDLSGFNGNVENYAIHNAWTMDDKEFPCSNDSLYDIYDPYDNENSLSLPPSAHYGSLATVDRVKVGDLSRKHGTFEGLHSAQRSFSDTNAPLFAPRSIIGRSLVFRAAVNDFRWVCGSIELDYDKSESRLIVAMASFDEPRSKVAGYIRLMQLEHKDGSLSDTYAQIDLRLQPDGVHELQTSQGHNWAVFVNQVGEEAFISADDVRCIASGFKWNPYLAQDTLETYANSCNPSERLACAMGDLGLRHGPLTLGPNNRKVISDSNLPLVGNYSVMGRSIVVFDNKRPNVKLACANIFPDIHLKSNVVIKRIPSFTVSRFVEQMRQLLGAADWLLVPELRATKPVANGECVQMTLHFYGQKAHQLQVELNNLVTLGTVRKSSRFGNGEKISTHYKLCRAGQMQLTSSTRSLMSYGNQLLAISTVFLSIFLLKT